ncbi:MAG TPA: hypothetical protein VF604_06285 [Pyrinomonadaceae bacterium]|jgi:hypothetical protein
MNQQNINRQDEFQTVAEEVFFDEETVQTIPAVMPLDETPTRTAARFKKLRVPMRKPDNSFNPAFLIMALLAVTALGVIAGTLLYRTSAEKSANNAVLENDDSVNRTIPAQYQFVVDKPATGETKDNLSRDNSTSLPSTSAPVKKDSRDKQDEESSVPDAENEQQTTQNEEVVRETEETPAASEEDEEMPPPPPLRRDRKEDKKQNKDKQKNKNVKPETQEEEPPTDESEN